MVITIYGFIHARSIATKKYTIHIGDAYKNKDNRIVLLSDIHIGTYIDIKQLGKIVSIVNKINADMILIAGDTFDQDAFWHCNLEAVRQELCKLNSNKKVYAILGNHDPSSGNKEIRDFFKQANIHLLIDEAIETEDFAIIGRDDILGNPNRKKLYEMLENLDTTKKILVLDHNPIGIDEAIHNNASLVLCGHTHKGQFFPATTVTKMSYGKRGFYGYYKTDNTHSIVSSGVGFFQLPMRIGTDSEIVILDVILKK